MRQEFLTPLYFLTYGCWGYWQLKQWTGRFLSMWTGRSASFSLISGPLFLPLRSRQIAPRQQWICEGTPSTHTHLSGHPGCYLFQETFCDSSSLMASLLPQGEPQKHLVYLTYFFNVCPVLAWSALSLLIYLGEFYLTNCKVLESTDCLLNCEPHSVPCSTQRMFLVFTRGKNESLSLIHFLVCNSSQIFIETAILPHVYRKHEWFLLEKT